MCTVVLRLQPDAPQSAGSAPLLLLGVRDEFTDRPWRPPARHWAGSPLIGGIDEQAGGTWLAVHPGEARLACLLNGRGTSAAPETRRSRGELPLRAAADGAPALKELAGDLGALAAYDPFHLVCADTASALLLSWDGAAAELRDMPPGTHLLTNAGHSYPPADAHGPVTEPKAAYFGPKFATSARALEWLSLAGGDGLPCLPDQPTPADLPPEDPRAIVVRRTLPDGRTWGTTSQTLIALAPGGTRYWFRPVPGEWYVVPV